MLVKLLYEDAECILNAEMHVNPEHIVSVRMRDDNKVGYLELDASEHLQQIGGDQYEKSSYLIDRESYDRIVAWMEKHDE